jgi:hypothetical protein
MDEVQDSGRDGVCLVCRTHMHASEICDLDPEHEVVHLADDVTGLRRLHDDVWAHDDDVPYRRILTWVAAAVFSGPFISICSSRIPRDAAILVVALYFVALALGFVRLLRTRNPPVGVPELRASELGKPTAEGRVEAAETIRAPLSGTDCAAFGVRVLSDGSTGGPVILREARAAEIDVVGDDGRTVRVPAGRVRLIEHGTTGEIFEGAQLASYLGEVGRAMKLLDKLDPVDEAEEVVIEPGDRIALYGDVGEMADPEPSGYREIRWLRVALGTPILELRRRDRG